MKGVLASELAEDALQAPKQWQIFPLVAPSAKHGQRQQVLVLAPVAVLEGPELCGKAGHGKHPHSSGTPQPHRSSIQLVSRRIDLIRSILYSNV